MRALTDYLKECDCAATPGDVVGTGNPTAPTDETPGSGDTFDHQKRPKRKRKNKVTLESILNRNLDINDIDLLPTIFVTTNSLGFIIDKLIQILDETKEATAIPFTKYTPHNHPHNCKGWVVVQDDPKCIEALDLQNAMADDNLSIYSYRDSWRAHWSDLYEYCDPIKQPAEFKRAFDNKHTRIWMITGDKLAGILNQIIINITK